MHVCFPEVFWACLSPKVVFSDISSVEVSFDTSTNTFDKYPISWLIWSVWRIWPACSLRPTVIKPLFPLLRRCACAGWLIWFIWLITSLQGSCNQSRILTVLWSFLLQYTLFWRVTNKLQIHWVKALWNLFSSLFLHFQELWHEYVTAMFHFQLIFFNFDTVWIQ